MGKLFLTYSQAATPSAEQLLIKNANIDYVVKYDGEEGLLKLIELLIDGNGKLEDVPNLVYRKDGKIIENPVKSVKVTELPIANRSLSGIDMNWYINNFKAFGYPEFDELRYRVTNSFSQKGCPRRREDSSCSFCARIYKKFNARTPYQTYMEYRYLRDWFGVNYIFDDSDSWIRLDFMKKLYQCYEEFGDLGIKIRVYGDVRDIRPATVKLMKKLNVVSVLIGIESGSERILDRNYKPMRKEEILYAVNLLAENDITVCASYVIGLIDEDKKTLDETLELSRQVTAMGNLKTNYWNMITPIPGSPIWDEMMQVPNLNYKYGGDYKFDIEKLRSDYVNQFCNLGDKGYEYLKTFLDFVLEELNVPAKVREYLR
jgi:anaerobic magnesium-protoporphyrin IX monomethyl ester cyclase